MVPLVKDLDEIELTADSLVRLDLFVTLKVSGPVVCEKLVFMFPGKKFFTVRVFVNDTEECPEKFLIEENTPEDAARKWCAGMFELRPYFLSRPSPDVFLL